MSAPIIRNLTDYPLLNVLAETDEENSLFYGHYLSDGFTDGHWRHFRVIAGYYSEGVASAEETHTRFGVIEIEGETVDVCNLQYSRPVNLPEPKEDVVLIVSRETIEAAIHAGRTSEDLLYPVKLAYSSSGSVMGCTAFGRL